MRIWLRAALCLWACHSLRCAAAADIQGKVSTAADGINILPLLPGTVIEVVLTSQTGDQIRTFADKDGFFALRDVEPGTHVISTYNKRFVYPEVRIEVSRKGVVEKATLVFNGALIPPSPLIIRPAGEAQYYEVRKPVDVLGFIKTPYGLMIAFSVFAMVIMPMMKVDPEEYREAMANIRGGDTGGGGGGSSGGQQPPQYLGGVQQRRQIRDR